MANWTKPQVWRYLKEHDLPHNPLYDLGYSSIGCAPCTRLRFAGEPERAGRWAGIAKWECGIHRREAGRETMQLERSSRVMGQPGLRRRPRAPRAPGSSRGDVLAVASPSTCAGNGLSDVTTTLDASWM